MILMLEVTGLRACDEVATGKKAFLGVARERTTPRRHNILPFRKIEFVIKIAEPPPGNHSYTDLS